MTLAAILLGMAAGPLFGQMLPPTGTNEIAGLPQVRPTVPLAPPRPAEGPDGRQTWNLERQGGDANPTAAFIESLKGSDAALELIVGQGRILTTRGPIAAADGVAVIAIGDPTVLDFEVLPNPRMIRLTGRRAGVTDLTIVNADDETYIFEVHVGYDLALLRAQLQRIYPDALIRLAQFREHIVIEGQARSTIQLAQIEDTVRAFLLSVQIPSSVSGTQPTGPPPPDDSASAIGDEAALADLSQPEPAPPAGRYAQPELGGRPSSQATIPPPQVINLLRVPGLQQRQVMLHVRVAELNRTGLREIGASMTYTFGDDTLESLIFGGTPTAIYSNSNFEIQLQALRQNRLLTVLAEPNLIAMDGHRASFLSGGQFPVPIQQAGSGGVAGGITVEWKNFGVQLNFVPTILDDQTIRLSVAPEVSSIDEALGTILVEGGTPVPGINTRRVETTVELREGQTLVLAGLLQVTVDGVTSRIPGLGDLPYLGVLFSSTTHERQERELLVVVTPYMVAPLEAHQVPCLPGAEITDPNDLEFYLMNRIEGRRGREFRSTTAWDDPLHLVPLLHLERDHCYGPVGFSP